MKEETKGIYLAILLSLVVIFITNSFFEKKGIIKTDTPQVSPAAEEVKNTPLPLVEEPVIETRTALSEDARVEIVNPAINGSLRIKGSRFDNLLLAKYKQTMEKDSPAVELLNPAKTNIPYYAEFGWLSSDNNLSLPDKDTNWKVKGAKLTPETPLILEWDNARGLKFFRKISIDENYMFTIEDSVENNTNRKFTLYPYGLINRAKPESLSRGVVHEGPIGVLKSNLFEENYGKIEDDKVKDFETDGGWAGFSDRYWFSSIILNKGQTSKVKFSNTKKNSFQVDYVGQAINLEANAIANNNIRFFAGAKEIKLIDKYAENQNIEKFDLSVDFGWYYFLTKPFFYILDYLYKLIGNMGWAILLFAALLRLAMYPIANKSYESMSKMKKVQPKMQELKERYGSDKMRLQQETLALYKKEKINPAAGCLPLLIQIPVFFSLYKVLNIAIEIRHAPFIGWIKDLSAPDPLTLSVILHFPIPAFLNIGVWPIVMGLTMYIQQKLNPAPVNKDQARMFAMMPIIFTFMMGHFASGLVIYWTLSNILSIIQQKAIMRKYGVK